MTDITIDRHFHSVDEKNCDEIAGHIRQHLIAKFEAIASPYLCKHAKVLDIGCGDGAGIASLAANGVHAIGIDTCAALIRRGKERYPHLCHLISEGNVLRLKFDNNTFDVAIMNILHHTDARRNQHAAIQEALRVVKKDGVLIIRECNLFNPLFRIYWNYLFPLTVNIDRFGGENWIPPRALTGVFNLTVAKISYCTFLPSITPKRLMPLAAKTERVLERTLAGKLAAHYVAVIKKRDNLNVFC